MDIQKGLPQAAELFKALGNESRLELLVLLDKEPLGVSALAELANMSQPLVSQHLRTLRAVGLVTATRHGKEMIYSVADAHVAHVVTDALIHVQETLDPQ
ncbi:ArsR family transcriptional regulator [Arcanobacterium haemolyticum]|uniref:Transcriptional regulator, ArsR family n=2 Tax=Arcanobacterium haemolyticum TaxID=28264 RepID=D7BMT9_ARCHD|nr:metalloregulator ArsR/SmtB family transcription factor [Arcanobacterium haemolyticum]ADH92238.1 transcriptional regulator, ArsR family [Arcanobacterium haemolyticum DSM 20595]QCX46390.1 ArsR family transcriptional regulator [Arcanobacterium haemolyticum]SQH29051.1 Transcriptional repressor smtB homolog [Arcanobacterium haemolyticum]